MLIAGGRGDPTDFDLVSLCCGEELINHGSSMASSLFERLGGARVKRPKGVCRQRQG